MSCANYLPLISRLLDGELPPSDRIRVESHLIACESCRRAHEDWRAQGAVMRGFFAAAALDESFVARVRLAGQNLAAGSRPAVRSGWFGYSPLRWAQAIAAAAVLAILAFEFLPRSESVATALSRVQVLSIGSGWTDTPEGSHLRAGDWVQNPQPGPAIIQLGNSTRITLPQGSVAEIREPDSNNDGRVMLVRGSLTSKSAQGRAVHVQTAAGVVTSAPDSRFGMEIRRLNIPKLMISDDRSEVLSGSVLPFGGVRVESGTVRIQAGDETHELVSGRSAQFTTSQVSVMPVNQPAGVTVSLGPARAAAGSAGVLSSSVINTESGLQVQIRADAVPLKRLLESTTGEVVVGGDGIPVSGTLSYPVEARPDEIVSAISGRLGVSISLARGVRQKTASIPEAKIPLLSEVEQSAFVVRKSPEGRLSYEFRHISAGQVFNTLRSENVSLPQLADEDEWLPVSLQATDLEPGDVARKIQDDLKLVVKDSHSDVRVILVGTPAELQSAALGSEGLGRLTVEAAVNAPGGVAAGSSLWAPSTGTAGPWGGILASGAGLGVARADVPAAGVAALPTAGAVGGATASAASKISDLMDGDEPSGARHLVWPAWSSARETAAYVVSNELNRSVRTIWNGYDEAGRLVAQQELILEPLSSLTIQPAQDLPDLRAVNSHWETLSDAPISGNGEMVVTREVVSAVDSDSMPAIWEFDPARLGSSGALWFANPSDEFTRIVIAVASGDEALHTEQVFLAPHMGATWSLQLLLAQHPELAGQLAGSAILVKAMEGSVAAAPRTPDRVASRDHGRGELVQ